MPADPSHRKACNVDEHIADLLEQPFAPRRAQQRLMDPAQRGKQPIESYELIGSPTLYTAVHWPRRVSPLTIITTPLIAAGVLVPNAVTLYLQFLVLAAGILLAPAPTHAQPRIELYTMGPGRELFSAFGHAAICVLDEKTPEGRCYNYGTADFSTPVPLTWSFIRGRARFWVSESDIPEMLENYVRADRTVFRQRLALSDQEATAVAARLAASTDANARYYLYHHFNDNCTTRIRDVLDRATAGALHVDVRPLDATFRERALEGFVGSWPLLSAVELFLGRSADQRTDTWTSMFLPSELRAEVAARYHAQPEVVYARRAALPTGEPKVGSFVFGIVGVVLALLLVVGARIGPTALCIALVPTSLVLGLVALVLDLLAALSVFPELRYNEAVLAFWPTDLLMMVMPLHWLRRYAMVRFVAVALVLVGHLVGLVQPLAPFALLILPLCALMMKSVAKRTGPR